MSIDIVVVVSILQLLVLTSASHAKQVAILKLERVRCTSTECSTFDCRIVRRSSRIQLMSGHCQLRAATAHVHARVQLLVRYAATARYTPLLYDVDLDVCDWLGERRQTQLMLDVARPYLERYTRGLLDQRCPATGNVTLHEMEYDMGMLGGVILPIGQYRADMRVYESHTNATIFYAQTFIRKLYEEFVVRHKAPPPATKSGW